MGGASTSSFKVDRANKLGVFNGTCAIIPYLKAPGFAKISTSILNRPFADVSDFIDGGMQLRVRSVRLASLRSAVS